MDNLIYGKVIPEELKRNINLENTGGKTNLHI